MSEIQVLIPLSLLGDAESLTPQAITAMLQKPHDDQAARLALEMRVANCINTIQRGGAYIEDMMRRDEITCRNMDCAKALRKMIDEMKGYE